MFVAIVCLCLFYYMFVLPLLVTGLIAFRCLNWSLIVGMSWLEKSCWREPGRYSFTAMVISQEQHRLRHCIRHISYHFKKFLNIAREIQFDACLSHSVAVRRRVIYWKHERNRTGRLSAYWRSLVALRHIQCRQHQLL